jgi:hypothetical protein
MSSLLVRHPMVTNCRPEGRQFRVKRSESAPPGDAVSIGACVSEPGASGPAGCTSPRR